MKGESDFTRVALAMNRMAERLRGQIDELERDAERRKQLLADVAHELRTPVMTMQTMCSAMVGGLADQPERKQQALASLHRASERLSRLVSDLLELAKLDLKELPIHLQKIEVRELLTAILQNHAGAARQLQVILHELDPGPPVEVMADPERLTQILDNLVNNAIHHAGSGATVQLSVEPGDPVQIKVADTGKGIAPEHLPYLFDPFYRVDQVRTPGDPHCGLGLRIARGLAEAHHGRLTLSSRIGQGTTAIVSLPHALPL
jgi:signal transduction histidine kinase